MESHVLASQLRCPNGAEASEVAQGMNKANAALNHKCIDLLQISAFDSLLEIGPGNGAFVADILNVSEGVRYTGLDWSAEMVAEAERLNKELMELGRVQFHQGASENPPF